MFFGIDPLPEQERRQSKLTSTEMSPSDEHRFDSRSRIELIENEGQDEAEDDEIDGNRAERPVRKVGELHQTLLYVDIDAEHGQIRWEVGNW